MNTQKIREEIRKLIPIVTPLALAQITQASISVVDAIMAGNVSALDLAAVSVGGSMWFITTLFITGVLMSVTPSIAHLRGANNSKDIPLVVQQGLYLAIFLGIFGVVVLQNAEPLLQWVKVDPVIIPLAVKYLYAISWGAPLLAIFFVMRSYCEGLGYTRPVFVASSITLVVNIIANYVLIYGKWGFPRLGGVGCGWASTIAIFITVIFMYHYIHKDEHLASFSLFAKLYLPNFAELTKLVRLGFPIGAAILAEASSFSIVAIFVASIGPKEVAAHQISMNVASILFMLPLSVGLGATIRIGHNLGEGSFEKAKTTCFAGVLLAFCIALVNACIIYFLAFVIANMYTNDPLVIKYAVDLMFYAALFQVSDAIQVSVACSLRGYKDTRIPMVMTFFSYWGVAIPLGYFLGLSMENPLGANGFWIGLVSGLSVAAILLSMRLYFVMQNIRRQNDANLVQAHNTIDND
ncbi:MATE family efflux transporter [Candidatus Uabimicrobium amorphum]|uniref:Multidrug-efflux transporter n=1 Tax=Uabimicrobium amorphum TaxID=2596890 RepID=A0A5S9IRS5_UABAM|nr:MATE family efflux transporter [Candidatus Uabimicrobium amorphum]BBM85495.1 MATE family efflux transporter [Candidatus Uabimicrobium amorphum]